MCFASATIRLRVRPASTFHQLSKYLKITFVIRFRPIYPFLQVSSLSLGNKREIQKQYGITNEEQHEFIMHDNVKIYLLLVFLHQPRRHMYLNE